MPRYIGHSIDNTASKVIQSSADPHLSSVVLLMDMNGNITDSSSVGRIFAAEGTAAVSTTQQKFGTHSLSLDGNSDRLSTPNSLDFDFAAGNFTIECWIRINALYTSGLYGGICNQVRDFSSTTPKQGWLIDVTDANKVQMYAADNRSDALGTWHQYGVSTTTLVIDTWYHVAITRSGTDIHLFINGALEDTTAIGAVTLVRERWNDFLIGDYDHSGGGTGHRYFNGYIDGLRITKGVARYTSTFTLPTVEVGKELLTRTGVQQTTDNKYNSGVWSLSESSGENYSVNSRKKDGKWEGGGWFPGASAALSITKFSPGGDPVAAPADHGTYLAEPGSGTILDFTESGYYQVTLPAQPAIIDMWAWGGAGGSTADVTAYPTAGPGSMAFGGAGGGVRGRHSFSGGDIITVMVAEGGIDTDGLTPARIDGGALSFPDGGIAGDNSASGGGSSRIADGLVPFANRNNAPTVYLLIGAGGGGGSRYSTTGNLGMAGGYPSGLPGGGYWPSDGANFGSGGTQSAGGPAPGNNPPTNTAAGGAGAKYLGGSTAGNLNPGPGGPGSLMPNNGGGGGGGGYYGGSAGAGHYTTGGGGSSYIHPSLSSTASFSAPGAYPASYWMAVDDSSNPGTKPDTAGEPYWMPHAQTEIIPAARLTPDISLRINRTKLDTGTLIRAANGEPGVDERRAGFVRLKFV
jgi:hypothetical protein